ncbi:MAG: Hsp20 family protein [Alphaproteobacteria bacterium]
MRTFDVSPLYRSTVGFDRLFKLLDGMATADTPGSSYPPYNIERTGENAYRISMAVAGFSDEELSIESRENALTVKGDKSENDDGKSDVLYRGIAGRSFERRFQLADYVNVVGAKMENGLLHIDLVRELPEAMKPRKIEIASSNADSKQIEANAA